MSDAPSGSLARVLRHARLRWAGAPLLLTGLGIIGLCAATFLQGGSGYPIFLGLLGTGLGLAAFGANHEAAMALALQVHEGGDTELPEGLVKELTEEMQRDQEGMRALRAFPKTAQALPVIAVLVQAGTAWLVLA